MTDKQDAQKFIALRLLSTLTNRVLQAISEDRLPYEPDDEDNMVILKDFLKEQIEQLPSWTGGQGHARQKD